MAAICLESICLCCCRIRFNSILLEEELKSNEVFAKEVDIVEDGAIIKCVSRLSTSSAGLTGVKVFIGRQRIDAAVVESFEMIEPCKDRDVTWVIIIEGCCIDCFGP